MEKFNNVVNVVAEVVEDGDWLDVRILGFDNSTCVEKREEVEKAVAEVVNLELAEDKDKEYIRDLAEVKERKEGCEYIVVEVELEDLD